MADETTPQQPNLVEQYAQSVNQRKLEAEAQMKKLIDSLNARKNMPFDPTLMRVAGALLAPTKTGSFGESLGYAATAATDEAQKQAQMNAELAKMEFDLRQKQAEQQQAADAMKFRMQYFGGKPQAAAAAAAPAVSAAPAAPRLTAAPALEAQQLTATPQASTSTAPAVLSQDISKAPPPAAPAAPTTYTPRFSASDLAVLGVVDKESFDLATKLEEQQRKAAELAANERQARAKELEQELKKNTVNVFGVQVPFTNEERGVIDKAIENNDIASLEQAFRNKGVQSPYVLRDGKVKVLPQEEWTARQKAAETLGMVKRTIRGKDYEMTAQEALEHDAAKRAGRDKYKSWVNNFFEQGSDLYTEPAPSAAPSAAAPSAAAPPAAAPAKAPSKAGPPLSVGEREVEQAGKTKAVEANVAAQAKKSEELSAAVESSGERYQAATTILDLINDDKFSGAQGYFAQPGFKNAFVNFLKDGIRLGNYSLGVPALADSLQQVGMTPAEAEAKATILQRSGELRMQLAAMLKGSVSNFEQVLLGNISGSVDTPLTSMRAAMSTIKAKAVFDQNNNIAYEKWREKNPYASPGKYLGSDEYKSARKGYLDEVIKINNFYFPKSTTKAPASPQPSSQSGSKFLK